MCEGVGGREKRITAVELNWHCGDLINGDASIHLNPFAWLNSSMLRLVQLYWPNTKYDKGSGLH